MQVFLNPPDQVCVSWNGIDGANQYKVYDGSGNFIESAAVANTPKCFPSGVGTCFIVSAVTNNGETAKSAPSCVGGAARGPGQSSTTNNPPQNVPAITSSDPTGKWRVPSDNSSANIGGTLHFEATADASHGVKGVNFTGIRPGNGSNWETLCQGQPLHDDVYGCDWSVSGVSQGDLIIGFDVYDGAGGKAPSPDHNRIVHLTIQFGCISGGTQGAGCSSTPASATPSHRYIVFLDGILSHSSADKNASLNDSFGKITDVLKAPENGLTDSTFVYFSYSAARFYDKDGNYCEGWGDDACNGGMLDFSRTPIYVQDDTKQALDSQVAALNWLLTQVRQHDQKAQIDLVGYSLGGVIASSWGANFDKNTQIGAMIHSIVIIDSPVGGIPLAGSIIDGCDLLDFRCHFFDAVLKDMFGERVLQSLRMDSNFMNIISNAARHYPFTAIQSTTDYVVNDSEIPFCGNPICFGGTPTSTAVGIGPEFWPGGIFTQYLDQNLGGDLVTDPISNSIIGDLSAKDIILKNHGYPLTNDNTAKWVLTAIKATTGST